MPYIQRAMHHVKYEILPDDGSYFGEIQECNGVYASSDNVEDCRQELPEVRFGGIVYMGIASVI